VRVDHGGNASLLGIYARSLEFAQLVDDYSTNFAKQHIDITCNSRIRNYKALG
jgi:hypothetical protein